MEYITAQEAAEKCGITKRRVQRLCHENRIEGAQRLGNMWAIPKGTDKPIDARTINRQRGNNNESNVSQVGKQI